MSAYLGARPQCPSHVGIFLRSFPLHSHHYAPETIAEICSTWNGLATALMAQTGSGESMT